MILVVVLGCIRVELCIVTAGGILLFIIMLEGCIILLVCRCCILLTCRGCTLVCNDCILIVFRGLVIMFRGLVIGCMRIVLTGLDKLGTKE